MPIDAPIIHKGRFGTQNGSDGRPRFDRGCTHPDINIFKNLARGNAAAAVGRFDKIVAGLTAVLPTESVNE